MTEDFTPSIHIEPPSDSDSQEQTLFELFDTSYCPTSQSDFNMNFTMGGRCNPELPALFIQGSQSASLSSELSPLEEAYLQTETYRYSPATSGRSSPIESWSPASSFGDIFPEDYSPDDFAPRWPGALQHFSGSSSPAAISPESLSPLTLAFDGFALDEGYLAADDSSLSSGPHIQRLRSSSHSVQNASSPDIWADGVGRGRSASFSGQASENQFYQSDIPVQQGIFPPYGYPNNNEVRISVADVDPFSETLGTGMSWGSVPIMNGNEVSSGDNLSGAGILVQDWRYPGTEHPSSESHLDRPPPSPSHLTVPGLQRRSAYYSRRSHSHSDLRAMIPEEAGRGRGRHRAAHSVQHSRSVSNDRRDASPAGLVLFSVQTPSSYSPSAPSSPAFEDADLGEDHGVSIERRHTVAGHNQTLTAPSPRLVRASSAPSKGRRSRPMLSPASGLSVFKAERTDTSSFLSSPGSDGSSGGSQQEFRVSQPDPSASFKSSVASNKIRKASDARRTNAASFSCPYCPSTFTARHNLTNHINSHNQHRPHGCSMCARTFTTQGVLNRHKKHCCNTAA
ncbi:hypothetical protein B0H15DRAFT_853704 [Mycena belliarum]|uniref:C2H2-type domain-containing protein n=1 Tax=Mycena belliarum TaxID=1033014 RepID=A0AAD6XNA4_9AGAR|nr:hypothetical protein B0H15DRAFT_853704 [Mycena belliae]